MHQVRYFLALCQTLNFTRAAEQCNVTQPSLTRAIKKLEDELGGPLFRRERNRTHCTALGNVMRPHLQRMLDASHAATEHAEQFATMETAHLDLGVMCTIGPSQLVGVLGELSQSVPQLDVRLHDASGSQLVERLMSGEIDIAIIGMPTIPPRFDARTLYRERYVVAFPRGHRFERMNAVPLRELNGENYLSRINCEYDDYLDRHAVKQLPTLNVRYESERELWIQALIAAGMGCSIMPEYLAQHADVAKRMLIEPDVSRDIQLVTVAGRRYAPPVEAFIRLIRQYNWSGR